MEVEAIASVLLLFGVLNLLSTAMLALEYLAKAKYNQYPVPKMFALKWILITGPLGFITSGNEEGMFWRHLRDRMDSGRTNAPDIAACKANLRRLERLPRTNITLEAIGAERNRLKALRGYDNEVASAIGVDVLASDLTATHDAVAAGQETLSDIPHLPNS